MLKWCHHRWAYFVFLWHPSLYNTVANRSSVDGVLSFLVALCIVLFSPHICHTFGIDHSQNKNCRHRWVWYVSIDNNGNKIRERVRKCFAIRLSFREHGNLLQPKSMKLPTTPVAVKSFPFVKLGENNHKPIFCFHWIKCANEKNHKCTRFP